MTHDEAGRTKSLTLSLPQDVALRLEALAAKTGRPAAQAAVEVLDKNLPRLQDPTKKIPYT